MDRQCPRDIEFNQLVVSQGEVFAWNHLWISDGQLGDDLPHVVRNTKKTRFATKYTFQAAVEHGQIEGENCQCIAMSDFKKS